MQKRVEVRNWVEAAQPACQAGATAPAEHRQGIKDGAITNEIEHRVDLLALRDAGTEVTTFDFNSLGTQLLDHGEPVPISRCGNDMGSSIDRQIERCLSKR